MMDIFWHLVPFPPPLATLSRIKEVGLWGPLPDSLNCVLNILLAVPMRYVCMGLEGRRMLGAIVPHGPPPEAVRQLQGVA